MTHFRGIEQKNIVESIENALTLLETHSIGPVCQKAIDDIRTADPFGKSDLGRIKNATDDIEMSKAMSTTGVNFLLAVTYQVLLYHALNDTDGNGLDVFKNLWVWDAMGTTAFIDTPLSAEVKKFLKTHNLEEAYRKNGAALEAWINTNPPAIVEYLLVSKEMTSGTVAFNSAFSEDLAGRVMDVLHPFYQLREVRSVGRGGIGQGEDSSLGIIFRSTRRAAEAVAAAFPGEDVLNTSSGEKVSATFTTSRKGPQNKP